MPHEPNDSTPTTKRLPDEALRVTISGRVYEADPASWNWSFSEDDDAIHVALRLGGKCHPVAPAPDAPEPPRIAQVLGTAPAAHEGDRKPLITHAAAAESLQRFIDGAFGAVDTPRLRLSIPARPDHDDDLILSRYIAQQRASGSAAMPALESPEGPDPLGWHKGPPTRERGVLVRDVERPGFQALCCWDRHRLNWSLRWTPGGGELLESIDWPESYRWHVLPEGPDQ